MRYEFKSVNDGNSPLYWIALPESKGEYTGWLASLNQTTDIGCFVLDYLSGGGTLIDVGANVGAISLPSAAAGSNVIAIEILPENCFLYSMAILKNRFGNVKLFQAAASDAEGIAHVAGAEAWGTVVSAGGGTPAAKLTIDQIVTLANIQSEGFVRTPILLKIDTEGHEQQVLAGAAKTVAELGADILFESILVEGRNEDSDTRAVQVKRYLVEHGYALYLLRGDKLIPQGLDDPQYGHVSDYFATRHRRAEGERIGRFLVEPVSVDGATAWIGEMLMYGVGHRMHAAGVVAKLRASGLHSVELEQIARECIADRDAQVAEFSARILR